MSLVSIDIKTHTIIKIHSTYNEVGEFRKIEQLYFAVVARIFLNKPALLITIAPEKKYSIGYELEGFREMRIERSKFLINDIKFCSYSMLANISRSEEFARGLLLLMANDPNRLANIEDSLSCIKNNLGLENLPYETVVCENDGRTLCLYNTTITKEALMPLVSNPRV